jgi:polygalacturonase
MSSAHAASSLDRTSSRVSATAFTRASLPALLAAAVACGASNAPPGVAADAAVSGDAAVRGDASRSDATAGPPADASDASSSSDGGSEDATPDGELTTPPPDDGGISGPDAAGGDSAATDAAADAGSGWGLVPTILSRIVPPTFPSLECDITSYGGVGDGVTDNTKAFASAIADCSARGGGRVGVPAGVFFTGPIEIKSNINLYVEAGATIKFTTDPNAYLPNVEVSWEGSLAQNYHPLVWAHDCTNIAITGAGTIDGNASKSDWYSWGARETPDQTNLRQQNANGVPPAQRVYGKGHYLRPGLIEIMRCQNVLLDSFTAKNSPFWTIHPVLSTNITATNFHSLADSTVVNTDGFDPEGCTDVLVQNASIAVGDDALAVKAGRDRDGWTYYQPSQNIVIRNSTMLSRWGGLTIGSEMSGGVRNVFIEDTIFGSTAANLHYGFYIKSAITRGGFIEDIYAQRIQVGTVDSFMYLTGHYTSGAVIGPTKFTTISNINVDGATVSKTTDQPFYIAGSDATLPATGIHFTDVTVTSSATPALESGSGHYSDLTTSNVVVNGAAFNPPSSAK